MIHVRSMSRNPYPYSSLKRRTCTPWYLKNSGETHEQAMDVGIVFVIAVNAAVIGIAIDTPQHMGIWEVVEIVPW